SGLASSNWFELYNAPSYPHNDGTGMWVVTYGPGQTYGDGSSNQFCLIANGPPGDGHDHNGGATASITSGPDAGLPVVNVSTALQGVRDWIGAAMPSGGFVLVQSASGHNTGSSPSIAVPIGGVTAGNLLLVYIASLTGTLSVSDGINAYEADAGATYPAVNMQAALYHSIVGTGGGLTVTVSGTDYYAVRVEEWSFSGTLSVACGTASGVGAMLIAPGAVTPAGGTLVVGMVANDPGATLSGASGFAAGGNIPFAASQNFGLSTQYRANAPASPYDPTFATSSS